MNDEQKEAAVRLAAGFAFLGLGLMTMQGWNPGSVFFLFMSAMFILAAKTSDGEDE